MNYTKNTAIFAFVALLMALPLVSSNAFGAGEVTIPGTCGFTAPAAIDMGTLTSNVIGTETAAFAFGTTGSTFGSLEVSAGDWLAAGSSAVGSISLDTVIITDAVLVDDQTFTATAATQDSTNFIVGGTDIVTAANLATAINLNALDDATATATENVVLVRTVTLGTAANSVVLSTGDTTITIGAGGFGGAVAATTKVMESEVTRFSITITGVDPVTSAYADKSNEAMPLDTAGDLVLVPLTDPAFDTKMRFHLTGVGTILIPYSGDLTQTLTFSAVCA